MGRLGQGIAVYPDALRAYQVDWNMFYQDVKPHA